MSRLLLELADDPPTVAAPAWVDHSAAVRTVARGQRLVRVSRGRTDEMSTVKAASAQLTVDNSDRSYDPASSTVRPGLHARLRLEHGDGSLTPLFRGYLEGIDPHHRQAATRHAGLRLVDAFKWLGGREVTLARPAEPTGTRVAAILDAAGWPGALRQIDTGVVEMLALEETGAEALAFIRDAIEAEDATCHVDAAGVLVFADRHHRLDLEVAAAIEVDDYQQVSGSWDDDLLVNVAKVELADGTVARHADADSVGIHGERLWQAVDPQVAPVEAEALGMWAVYRYAEAHERLAPIAFTIVDLAGGLAGRELGELVTVSRRWPDGHVETIDCVIEGITHNWAAARWRTTWHLSPWWGGADWLILADTDQDEVPGLDDGVLAP